jgi:hypothetical protein
MVQLTLPKNSKTTKGKAWERPAGASRVREFRIYRYDPDKTENPRVDTISSISTIARRWFSTASSGSRTRSIRL